MRARNIKPSFFKNEALAELPMGTRLLFIGLWGMADREGRLEDRPKRIKIDVFPADDFNVNEALTQLQASGFIKRYEVEGLALIQILNFVKHQRPHGTEKDSELPDADGFLTVNVWNGKTIDSSQKPMRIHIKNKELRYRQESPSDLTVNSLSHNALNPDLLNPDSLNPEREASFAETFSKSKPNALPTAAPPLQPHEPKAVKAQRAARLTADWVIPADWLEWARSERPDVDAALAAERFKDFWVAKAGKDAAKLDWLATWRNWIRGEKPMQRQTANGGRQGYFNRQVAVENENQSMVGAWISEVTA